MKKILSAFVALMLAACASDPRCPRIAAQGRYCLQALSASPQFSTEQKVEAHFKTHEETLLAYVEVDADALHFVALSPFGQKILQLRCGDHRIDAPLWPDSALDPAQLCALLQLTLWPEASVRAGLQAPLHLESGMHTRRIDADGQTLLQVHYEGTQIPYRRIELKMPTQKLNLDIETLADPSEAP